MIKRMNDKVYKDLLCYNNSSTDNLIIPLSLTRPHQQPAYSDKIFSNNTTISSSL